MSQPTWLAVAVLCLALPSAAMSSPEQALSDGAPPMQVHVQCDHHDKRCPPPPLEELGLDPVPAMPLGHPLTPLDRLLPSAVSQLLGQIYPDESPVDVPARPKVPAFQAAANASVHAALDAHLGPLRVEAEASASANARAASPGLGQGNGTATGGQVPCGDPRGCPDLVVDATRMLVFSSEGSRTFGSDDCVVVEGSAQAGQRRLLHFTFTTPNVGDGDLVVGAVADHPEWFEWGDCHGHWHFREYADYRLWTVQGYALWQAARADDLDATASEVLADHPELEEHFVAGHKQGFCVIDIAQYLPGMPGGYDGCATNQGISRGWADEYHLGLDGQWVDITDLPPGHYVLEAEVNAERLYVETDYANNAGAVLFALS